MTNPLLAPPVAAATVAALSEAFTFSELIAVLAVSEDKDVPAILDELEPALLVAVCVAWGAFLSRVVERPANAAIRHFLTSRGAASGAPA